MVAKRHYDPSARERFVPERHSSARGDFQRDRGRLIHSSALRRLAQKTQVLSPQAGMDFARNRLTHSLEVAQVGREIAQVLGVDPDVVDTACLAHDLGHPPFGHNGETALNAWANDFGGFEGNAQTFRVLTRLEPKTFDQTGVSRGLNLTRASLDASTKYPWRREQGTASEEGRVKFGVYDDDLEVFEWVRQGHPHAVVSLEAQVMDLSDDIAYSVHDFEDAIVNGYLDIRQLSSGEERSAFLDHAVEWSGQRIARDRLEEALEHLTSLEQWPGHIDGSRRSLAQLKNLTSAIIGRFAQSVVLDEADQDASLAGHVPSVSVPSSVRVEMSLLKGIVATAVMNHETRQPIYLRQREILTELLDALWRAGAKELDSAFAEDFDRAPDEVAQRRVVVDQVASLTDQSALSWHERVVRSSSTTV